MQCSDDKVVGTNIYICVFIMLIYDVYNNIYLFDVLCNINMDITISTLYDVFSLSRSLFFLSFSSKNEECAKCDAHRILQKMLSRLLLLLVIPEKRSTLV